MKIHLHVPVQYLSKMKMSFQKPNAKGKKEEAAPNMHYIRNTRGIVTE